MAACVTVTATGGLISSGQILDLCKGVDSFEGSENTGES